MTHWEKAMSSSTTVSWSTIIQNFITAFENFLNELGNQLAQNATVIADIAIGIGIVYFLVRYVTRIPLVRNVIGNLLG